MSTRPGLPPFTAGGIDLVQLFDDWLGRGPLASYCAVFRKAAVLR